MDHGPESEMQREKRAKHFAKQKKTDKKLFIHILWNDLCVAGLTRMP